MGRRKNWSDDELVRLIWDYRVADGTCSLGDLAKATGMTRSGLAERMQALVAEGRVLSSSKPGSLRAADERMMQELPDGRLLERSR